MTHQKLRGLDSMAIIDFETYDINYSVANTMPEYSEDILENYPQGAYFLHHRKASVGGIHIGNQHPFKGKRFLLSQNGSSNEFYNSTPEKDRCETDSETILKYIESKAKTLEEAIDVLDEITDVLGIIIIHHKKKTLIYTDGTRESYYEIDEKGGKEYLNYFTNIDPDLTSGKKNGCWIIFNHKDGLIEKRKHYNTENLEAYSQYSDKTNKIGKNFPKKKYTQSIQAFGQNVITTTKSTQRRLPGHTDTKNKHPITTLQDVQRVREKLDKNLASFAATHIHNSSSFLRLASQLPASILFPLNEKSQGALVCYAKIISDKIETAEVRQAFKQYRQSKEILSYKDEGATYRNDTGIDINQINKELSINILEEGKLYKHYDYNIYRYFKFLSTLALEKSKEEFSVSIHNMLYWAYLFIEESELVSNMNSTYLSYDISSFLISQGYFNYSFDTENFDKHYEEYTSALESETNLVDEDDLQELFEHLLCAYHYILLAHIYGFTNKIGVSEKIINKIINGEYDFLN